MRLFRGVFDKIGRSMSGATREIVYGVGKALGFKFRPWGAVKLARTLGKVGAIMSVVGVAVDIVDLFLAERRSAKREEARKRIAAFLRDSVPRVVTTVAYGSEEEPGVLRQLDSVTAILRELETEQSKTRKERALKLNVARNLLSNYGTLRVDASALLGNPWS